MKKIKKIKFALFEKVFIFLIYFFIYNFFFLGFAPKAALGPTQNVLYSCMKPSGSVKRSRRYIAKSPERILDAPGIIDDFCNNFFVFFNNIKQKFFFFLDLSLTDWSSSNVVAVGLGQTIYVWDADKGDADVLTEIESEAHPTLIKWSQEGRFLAIGLSDGSLKVIFFFLIIILTKAFFFFF